MRTTTAIPTVSAALVLAASAEEPLALLTATPDEAAVAAAIAQTLGAALALVTGTAAPAGLLALNSALTDTVYATEAVLIDASAGTVLRPEVLGAVLSGPLRALRDALTVAAR